MRVLGAIVEVLASGQLVHYEPQKDTEDDALVQSIACHVDRLVVDTVHLLHSLQVVLLGGRVGHRPQTQVVHVAQHRPIVLERDAQTCFLQFSALVLELSHADVVRVGDRLTDVLSERLHVCELVHLGWTTNLLTKQYI